MSPENAGLDSAPHQTLAACHALTLQFANIKLFRTFPGDVQLVFFKKVDRHLDDANGQRLPFVIIFITRLAFIRDSCEHLHTMETKTCSDNPVNLTIFTSDFTKTAVAMLEY